MSLLLLLSEGCIEGNEVDAGSPTATHLMRDGRDTLGRSLGGYAMK